MKRRPDNSLESNAGIPWIHVAHLLGESARVMLETCRVWHSQLTRIVHPMLLWHRPPTITKFMKRFVCKGTRLMDLPLDTQEIHVYVYDDDYDFSRFHRLKHLHYINDTVQDRDVLPDGLDVWHIGDTFDFTVLSNVFRGSVLCLNHWSGPSDMVRALTSLHVLVVLTMPLSESVPDSYVPPNLTQLHVPDDWRLGPRGQSHAKAISGTFPILFIKKWPARSLSSTISTTRKRTRPLRPSSFLPRMSLTVAWPLKSRPFGAPRTIRWKSSVKCT